MHDAERIWRDRGLRDAVLGGDEAAWRVLYERAYGPLRAFVTARSRAGAPRLDDSRVEVYALPEE